MVIEVETIIFEKLHHQHTQVPRRIDLSPSYLRMHLQEAHRQADDAVASQTAREHLVHGPLAEKCLCNEHECSKSGQFGEKARHSFPHSHPFLWVDKNIEGKGAMCLKNFDEGYFPF